MWNRFRRLNPAPSPPELSRQCRDNLLPIFGPCLANDISVHTVAGRRLQQNKFGIDRLHYSEPGSVDDTSNVGGKFPERLRPLGKTIPRKSS
jgi:hypothetical protein